MITIRPPGRWAGIGLRELWSFRELIYFFTKRDLQIRFKQTYFGVMGAVLPPVGLAFLFTLLFGVLIDVPSPPGVPYPVFAIVGIAPWLFIAQSVQQGSQSLVMDANLLEKVYFPRLAIPIAKSTSLMLDLCIALVTMFVVIALYGVGVSAQVALAPLFLLLGLVTAFALSTLFAALNVRYRDMLFIVPMLLQALLFLSPLIYPGDLVKGTWQYIYSINPIASVVDGMRWALLDTPPPQLSEVAVSVGAALLLLSGALLYFRRAERHFADIV